MHDTTGSTKNTFTRRLFLRQGLTFASMAATAPVFIERSARAMTLPLDALVASQAGVPEDRVLVIVQLGGGNDGLNTVVPYGDPMYYRVRPSLAIPAPGETRQGREGALSIDGSDGLGLHPSLSGLKELLDEGVASIVQGVGYPNPNRSHFTSMDIWHTGREDAKGTGWLGRYFDHECQGTPNPEVGVTIGRTAPLAMVGDEQQPVSFESADLFRWLGHDLHRKLEDPYHAINRDTSQVGQDDNQMNFLMRTALDAQVSSDRIRKAVEKRPLVNYPGGPLAQQLQIVGAMIRDELATRVYYVSLGGFDTHANQAGTHANLMRQVGGALNAFYKDLKAQGNTGRVVTTVFSEFGRRVAQNASGGTDHGTAAPMYLIGDSVRPGVLGDHPSLTNLDDGDLRFNVDFRSVYAALLEDWMGAPSRDILGGTYRKAKLFS